MKQVLVTVITYNNEDVIADCLASLAAQTHRAFTLLVVDNRSTDQTLRVVSRFLAAHPALGKKTRIVKNEQNVGFARSVNTGLGTALRSGRYAAVQLLNPDTTAATNLLEDGLQILSEYGDIGALCPKILYPDKKIWWIGTRLYTNAELFQKTGFGVAEHTLKGKAFRPNTMPRLRDVDALTGCAMMIRLDAVKKTGLFNEKYYMYMEDIDYSLRLKQHGYRVVATETSSVTHHTDDTSVHVRGSSRSNIRKYRIYLTSAFLYLSENRPMIAPFWLMKLPYVLFREYVRRNL